MSRAIAERLANPKDPSDEAVENGPDAVALRLLPF